MKPLMYFILLLYSTVNLAFTVWPDTSAPCNATLQACIDASPEGELIELRTNAIIDENINAPQAISLVAGAGYEPVFAAGRSIMISSNTSTARTVIVRGLTLTEGRLQLLHLGSNGTFVVERNHIMDNLGVEPSINIVLTSNADIDLQINYNRIHNDAEGPVITPYGALEIRKSAVRIGTVSGQIYGNTVTSLGIDSIGIHIQDPADGLFDMNIVGNEVYGGTDAGLLLHRSGGTGEMDMDVVSNAFYREGTFYFPSGIHVFNDAGTTNVDIVNNSMIDSRWGIELVENGGTLNADVFNNLTAYCGYGFDFGTGVTVNNDYNLSYENSFASNYTPGPNALNTDPKIRGLLNARLRPESPADGAGNVLSLLLVGDAPFIDADGLLRLKTGTNGNAVDIGAYERGDVSFYHRSANSTTHTTNLDNPETNNQPSLDNLHITSNYNPNLTGGVVNNENEGIYYDNLTSNQWAIFNEGLTNLPFSAAFNVAKYASVSNTFEHNNDTGGTNNTQIDNPAMNGNSDLIVQITQHWTGTYNPHPVGLLYFAPQWAIINLDLVNMPANTNFNVYFQSKSKSAWEHTAGGSNLLFNISYLDNPIINGVPCAEIQVTQSTTRGVFNNTPIGVGYSPIRERWYVFNQDGSSMVTNTTFHVLANPEQVAECTDLIFADDFD